MIAINSNKSQPTSIIYHTNGSSIPVKKVYKGSTLVWEQPIVNVE